MTAQLSLVLTPASRSTDGPGSFDAEERMNQGPRGENQRLILAGFVRWPMRTTKELAALTLPEGWTFDKWRTEIGRRAKELEPLWLERHKAPPGTPKGERELRWNPTEAGKRVAGRWE